MRNSEIVLLDIFCILLLVMDMHRMDKVKVRYSDQIHYIFEKYSKTPNEWTCMDVSTLHTNLKQGFLTQKTAWSIYRHTFLKIGKNLWAVWELDLENAYGKMDRPLLESDRLPNGHLSCVEQSWPSWSCSRTVTVIAFPLLLVVITTCYLITISSLILKLNAF